jgi:hypothetical protein
MAFEDMLIELSKPLNNKYLINQLLVVVVDQPRVFHVHISTQLIQILLLAVHRVLVVLVVLSLNPPAQLVLVIKQSPVVFVVHSVIVLVVIIKHVEVEIIK